MNETVVLEHKSLHPCIPACVSHSPVPRCPCVPTLPCPCVPFPCVPVPVSHSLSPGLCAHHFSPSSSPHHAPAPLCPTPCVPPPASLCPCTPVSLQLLCPSPCPQAPVGEPKGQLRAVSFCPAMPLCSLGSCAGFELLWVALVTGLCQVARHGSCQHPAPWGVPTVGPTGNLLFPPALFMDSRTHIYASRTCPGWGDTWSHLQQGDPRVGVSTP